MATTPEAKVKKRLVKYLKELGVYYFFPATHGFGRSGVADVIVCFNGHFIAIECKATADKELTALQKLEATKVEAAGGLSFVVHDDNVEEVVSAIYVMFGQAVPVHVKVERDKKLRDANTQRLLQEFGLGLAKVKKKMTYKAMTVAKWTDEETYGIDTKTYRVIPDEYTDKT